MWIKALNVIGWLATAAGIAIFILCLVMLLNRSPHDFEGMVAVSSVFVIFTVSLPAIVAGLLIVALTTRKKSGAAT